MLKNITLFSLIILIAGCAPKTVDMSILSPHEIRKINAVKVVEAKDLNKNSKVIKKIEGISCVEITQETAGIFLPPTFKVVKNSSRDEAVGQVKFYAVSAGGNAITNLECEYNRTGSYCWGQVVCTADIIQVDYGS